MAVEDFKQDYGFIPFEEIDLDKISDDQFIEFLIKDIRPQHRVRVRNQIKIYIRKIQNHPENKLPYLTFIKNLIQYEQKRVIHDK
ncbi:MAG: hypothetical protein ACFFEN_10735 [Candidatus Thorarchaeota archaeon]